MYGLTTDYRASADSVRCFKDSPDLTLTLYTGGGNRVAYQTGFKWWNPRNSKPTNPTRADATFAGWFTDNLTFQNEFVFSGNTYISKNTTLYAKWICTTSGYVFN